MRSLSLLASLLPLAASQDLVSFLQSQSDLSTLTAALQIVPDLAGTVANLTNITILAPTNGAFEALLEAENVSLEEFAGRQDAVAALLAYHVLNGTYTSDLVTDVPTYVNSLLTPEFLVDGAAVANVTAGQYVGFARDGDQVVTLSGDLSTQNVVEADLTAGSITVHKIDRVLSIPKNFTTTVGEAGATAAEAAVLAADLADTLDTLDDYTIFVPNNAAFESIASVLANASVETIQSVLQLHVVQGAVVFSEDIEDGAVVSSLQGGNLTLNVKDGAVFVNQAKVVLPNIILAGGVAHIIDAVLNPESTDVNDDDLNATAAPTPVYPNASSGELPFATINPTPTTVLSVPGVIATNPAVQPSGDASATGEAPAENTGAAGRVEVLGAAGALVAGVAAFLV